MTGVVDQSPDNEAHVPAPRRPPEQGGTGGGEPPPGTSARLVVGIVSLIAITVYLIGAWQLGRGSLSRPGTGTFPLLAGLIGAWAAGLVVWESRAGLRTIPASLRGGLATLRRSAPATRWVVFVSVLVATALLMSRVGFLPTAFVTALCVLRMAWTRGWVVCAVTALLIVVATELVFVHVFGVFLPVVPGLRI